MAETTPKIVLPVGNPTFPKVETAPVVVELELEGIKHKVAEDGSIKDDKGTILKTKDEVAILLKAVEDKKKLEEEEAKKKTQTTDPFTEGTEVDIDGVVLKIDKTGNAVDKDNKVVKTKDELKKIYEQSQSSNEVDYIAELQKTTNLVVTKDGKPIEYENTIEGLTGYTKDVHLLGRELGKEEAKNELFTQFPILKQVISHLVLNNGSLNNFNNRLDYSQVKLTDDETQWESIYLADKISKGISEKEAKDMFKYLKDDKKAKEAAESSLTSLTIAQKKQYDEAEQIIAQQTLQKQQEEIQYANEIASIIKSRTVKVNDQTLQLPEVIRIKDKDGRTITKTLDDFVKYLSEPIPVTIEGKTYLVTEDAYNKWLEEEKRTTNNDVFDAFRRFTKYDDAQLITSTAKSQEAKKVIKLSTKAPNNSSGTSKNTGKIVMPVR